MIVAGQSTFKARHGPLRGQDPPPNQYLASLKTAAVQTQRGLSECAGLWALPYALTAPFQMAAPRKQKHSQRELATMAGVSQKTIRDWRDTEGLDLSDVQAVMRRAATVASTDETLGEARRRRAVACADAEEIRVRRMKGELIETRIPRGVIVALDHALGMIWKNTPNEMTSVLDGLTGGKLRDELRKFINDTLIPRFAQRVSDGIAEIDASFSELKKVLPPSEP